MNRLITTAFATALSFVVLGCDRGDTANAPAQQAATAAPQTAVPAGFLLAQAPEGAKEITAVKAADVKDGDEVVVRGIVGGSEQPFVNNRAVVQLIDRSVKTCNKMPDDPCKTPWDACCDQDNAKAKGATLQVVDADGSPLKGTLEGVGGLKPLAEVVVKGKARTEGGKTLTIDATALHVVQ